MHRPARAAVVVVAVLALAACSAADRAASDADASSTGRTATSAPPNGLTASLVQYRRDQPRRYVEVKFANAGAEPLDVTMLDVTLPGFGPSGDIRRTTHLEADRRVDLPVALGDPRCDGPPTGAASVLVDVRRGGGPAVRATVPVDDDGLLARLRTFECAVRRAEAAADIALSPDWQRRGAGDDLVVRGRAVASLRDQAAEVEIHEVAGGILFIAPPEAVNPTPPVALDRGRNRAMIEFDLIPARCDGHAIAEARRLTTVTFLVSVDDTEPVPLRIAPDDAGFETLATALRDRCGTG